MLLSLIFGCSLWFRVLSQPHFEQPKGQDCGVENPLTKKCFAYSTLNALKECGIYDFTKDADAWILAKFSASMGGGPHVVVDAIKTEGGPTISDIVVNKADWKKQANLVTNTGKKKAAAIGINKGAQNHWCYATNPQTNKNNIAAYDQQTKQVRTFEKKVINQKAIDAATVKITKFNAMKAIRTKGKAATQPEKDQLKVWMDARTAKGIQKTKMFTQAPDAAPAKEEGWIDQHGWHITQIVTLEPVGSLLELKENSKSEPEARTELPLKNTRRGQENRRIFPL